MEHVSVTTVKTHMRHIYAKLGAPDGIEAVKQARQLGLADYWSASLEVPLTRFG